MVKQDDFRIPLNGKTSRYDLATGAEWALFITTGSLMFQFKDGRSHKWRTLTLPVPAPSSLSFPSPSSHPFPAIEINYSWQLSGNTRGKRSSSSWCPPLDGGEEGQPINSDKSTSNFLLVTTTAPGCSLSPSISLRCLRREKNFVKYGPRTCRESQS